MAQAKRQYELVAICDPQLLRDRAATLGLPLQLVEHDLGAAPRSTEAGTLHLLPIFQSTPAVPGQLDTRNVNYVLETLQRAVRGCQDGEFAAMVTGPVHKAVINDSGAAFTGHTEYLAALTRTQRVVMMLSTPRLRVALATTHLPLREVCGQIKPTLLEESDPHYSIGPQAVFLISSNRALLVAGLNPHAGEGGHLGREEIEIIEPVLSKLQAQGLDVLGPFPADTLFTPQMLTRGDAVLAMYHDQGLPVLKAQGFGEAVNVTLGLPIIRTSVDHGTALDLAGTDRADASSLLAAIECAVTLADNASRGA